MIIIKISTNDKSSSHLFFETPQMLTMFVSLGKYLEKLAEKKTTNAIQTIIDSETKSINLIISEKQLNKNLENLIMDFQNLKYT